MRYASGRFAVFWENISSEHPTSVYLSTFACGPSPLDVLRADAKGELPATPDTTFAATVFPWTDPEPVLSPPAPPLLFYRVEARSTPIFVVKAPPSVTVHTSLMAPL